MGRQWRQAFLYLLERDVLQPNYTSYVHSDNTAIGRKAGQFMWIP